MHEPDAALAARLVREAAALADSMRRQPDLLEVSRKTSVSDIVTAADHAAERFVVEQLAEHRPDDGILGEEGAERDGPSGRRWIIDPVDGTYNFASGSDYWCSAIALVDGDRTVLGAVAHHGTRTVWVGGPELPTTANGAAVPPMADDPVEEISGATYLHPGNVGDPVVREPFLRAASLPATIRMHGSGSMDLVGVATGRLGCWFQHSTPDWDWLPGSAIVAGAGGDIRRLELDGLTWSIAGGRSAVASIADALEASS